MTLRNRFLLVTFGVLVFIIATPILVLYARGFQIDWHTHKIVKTGSLVVKTLPTKATVLINGGKQKDQTPDTVRFLIPGDYVVTVEKEGYQSWTKRLPVNSQFATWANVDRDFITLFFKTAESMNKTAENFSALSKDGKELAYISDNKAYLYSIEGQSASELGSIGDLQVPFTFTDKMVWQNGADTYRLFQNKSAPLPIEPSKIVKAETNGQYAILLIDDQLYALADKMLLIDKNVSGFSLDGENIWYTSNNNLMMFNLRTSQTQKIISIPFSKNSQIIRSEGQTFLILDNVLYTVNDSLEKIYDNVTIATYDEPAHILLFANNNEILTYKPQQKTTDLILRSISTLTNPVLNSYTGYVFFGNEGAVKAIELDGRDHRNIYTITNLDNDTHFTLNSDGTVLTLFNNSQIHNLRIR